MDALKLKLSLREKIDEWVSEQAENTAFDSTVIGDRTAQCMADAAFAVMEAMHEAQEYGYANGEFRSDDDEDEE